MSKIDSDPSERPEPLSGLQVLDLSSEPAGELAGRLLAGLGASVAVPVPIQPVTPLPIHGDWHQTKLLHERRQVHSAGKTMWRGTWTNPEGRATLLMRCLDVDVLIEPEDDPTFAMEALLHNPRLVSAAITLYGRTGPWRRFPGADLCVQALMGQLEATGDPDGPPTRPGVPLAERATALFGVIAILAAVRERNEFETGTRIDVASLDALMICSHVLLPMAFSQTSTHRDGNHHPTASPWNVYRTIDGSIAICTLGDRQWLSCLEMIGRLDLADSPLFRTAFDRKNNEEALDSIIANWCGKHETDQVLEECDRRRIAAGRIATIDAIRAEQGDRLRERGVLHSVRVGDREVELPIMPFAHWQPRLSASARTPMHTRMPQDDHRDGPLRNIRVVELGQYTTGPLCSRILAGLGADVIKVEPLSGDGMRPWHPQWEGNSWMFLLNDAGKDCIAVDAKSADGRALIIDLIANSDVLVSNFSPGVMARLGLSDADVRSANPSLVNCEMTGFDSVGFPADKSASDTVIQAESGIMSITGWPGGDPLRLGISVCDVSGAISSTVAVVASLVAGGGACLNLTMFEAGVWLTEQRWLFEQTHDIASDVRCGNDHPVLNANGIYHGADGPIAIAVETPAHVLSLTKLLKLDTESPPHEVEQALREWLSATTVAELVPQLLDAGVPAAPVLRLQDALEHEQVEARRTTVTVFGDASTPAKFTNPAVGFGDRIDATLTSLPGEIGSRTESVLRSILGLDHATLVDLHARGVIGGELTSTIVTTPGNE